MDAARYKAAYDRLIKENPGISNANIQPSFLRLESTLLNNSTSYQFEVTTTQALAGTDTRRLLQRNNKFMALEHAFGLYEKDTSDLANSKEIIYAPVPGYFDASGANFNENDLEWLYQIGRMFMQVNNTVFMNDNVSLNDFRYAPQTQNQTLTAPGPALTTTNVKTQSPFNGGRKELLLPVTLNGNLDNVLKINAATPSGGINWQQDAANKEVRMVWLFWGLEVFNSQR